ncbi:uncharacterized protein LOC143850479 [Tasmannia lanceolata]|uniref:uncharacterized protein LOC143850479 n=1 Tax=Tasmannia lanceolata TaxID=3420 RepID=UPI00406386DD
METKAKVDKLADYAKEINDEWVAHGNYDHKFLLTSVYGLNYGGARRSLWDDLEQIAGSVTSPWIVLGDFNATRFSEERVGMAFVYPSYMEEFNSCIANCSLVDMQSDGQSLSWNNRSSEDRKLARLDRTLEENKLRDEFFRVAHLEENMTRQKASVDWLNLGDSNSSFFHSAIKSRLHRNHIVSMENTQGTTTNDPHQISEILVEHFHKLLNNGKSGCPPLPHPFSTLTSDEAAMLSAPVSSEEIKNAVFSTKGDKSF